MINVWNRTNISTRQVAPGVRSVEQLQLTPCRQFPEGGRELPSDHRDRGPRVEEALDLVLGDRPTADDDAAAPFEVEAYRVSERHVPPPTASVGDGPRPRYVTLKRRSHDRQWKSPSCSPDGTKSSSPQYGQ